MQTFLPYPDFRRSAQALDNRRLGKQRVEAYQIIRVLTGLTSGWRHHPAVRMWAGHVAALGEYLSACIEEWTRRGFRNSILVSAAPDPFVPPYWLGDPAFHASHRSNLLRKDPVWYGRFGWTEGPDLPYVWPERDAFARKEDAG